MGKFKPGDLVQMPGVPLVVEVLELGTCDDPDCADETFQFTDPTTGGPDWEHTADFERWVAP